MGEDDEPFLAPAGLLMCWFLCDFPGLLFSDLGPCCRTFTPRIICESQDQYHVIDYYFNQFIIIRGKKKREIYKLQNKLSLMQVETTLKHGKREKIISGIANWI